MYSEKNIPQIGRDGFEQPKDEIPRSETLERSMLRIEEEAKHLRDVIEQLDNRLDKIMAPDLEPDTKATTGNPIPIPAHSPLVGRLDGVHNALCRARAHAFSILERLEL